jgi:EAL domain-containing protein (putative c-di-GMP-specific phosphodiesterase class I)
MLLPEMEDEGTIQKDIAGKLVAALKEGGFVLYAQKILALGKGDGRPFQEILVRFKEEEEKLLPPGTFFPMLEEYHLLPYVDRWVVSRLTKWIEDAAAARPGLPPPHNGINLSADTLRDAKFGEYVRRYVERAKLPEGTLIFEFPWESAMMRGDALKRFRAEIRPAGCQMTLAGYDGSAASLGLLQALAPDFVKLGYGLVKDVDQSLAAVEKLESVCAKCRALRVKTIAEYVESPKVIEQLKLAEVDFAQGLAIAPPGRLT